MFGWGMSPSEKKEYHALKSAIARLDKNIRELNRDDMLYKHNLHMFSDMRKKLKEETRKMEMKARRRFFAEMKQRFSKIKG